MNKKESKLITITTKVNSDQFQELESKRYDDNGQELITRSALLRASILSSIINIVDTSFIKYVHFLLTKTSNNINQLAKKANIAAKENKLNDALFREISSELKTIRKQLNSIPEMMKTDN